MAKRKPASKLELLGAIIADHKLKNAQLQKQNAELLVKLHNLELEQSDTITFMNHLEYNASQDAAKIAQLKEDLSVANAWTKQQEDRADKLDHENARMADEKAALKQDIASLENKLAEAEGQIIDLQCDVSEAEKARNDIERTFHTVRDSIKLTLDIMRVG